MADFQLTNAPQPTLPNTFTAKAGAAILAGQPVYQTSADRSVLVAVAGGSSDVVAGIATASVPVGLTVDLQYQGPLTLTVAEWEAITNGAGLVAGTVYYLSPTLGGANTSLVPASGVTGGAPFVQIGIALSTVTLKIQLGVAKTTRN